MKFPVNNLYGEPVNGPNKSNKNSVSYLHKRTKKWKMKENLKKKLFKRKLLYPNQWLQVLHRHWQGDGSSLDLHFWKIINFNSFNSFKLIV